MYHQALFVKIWVVVEGLKTFDASMRMSVARYICVGMNMESNAIKTSLRVGVVCLNYLRRRLIFSRKKVKVLGAFHLFS